MDWTGCELVEVTLGNTPGLALVVGTQIPADEILDCVDSGIPLEEIIEDYPALLIGTVQCLACFARSGDPHSPMCWRTPHEIDRRSFSSEHRESAT